MSSGAAGRNPRDDDFGKFAIVAAGMAVTMIAAFGFGALLAAPPLADFELDIADGLIGLVAAAPLAIALEWLMRARAPAIAAFRETQISFLSAIGFRFTPARIAILSLGAGISEEMLFRGVFQAALAGLVPAAIAIILPNILFGMLHWRTTAYALIAGAVGAYFGLLFLWTGNLLAPIVAHAAYDAFALARSRAAIDLRAGKGQARSAE